MSAEDSRPANQSRPDLADQSGREARCAIAAEPKGSMRLRRDSKMGQKPPIDAGNCGIVFSALLKLRSRIGILLHC